MGLNGIPFRIQKGRSTNVSDSDKERDRGVSSLQDLRGGNQQMKTERDPSVFFIVNDVPFG